MRILLLLGILLASLPARGQLQLEEALPNLSFQSPVGVGHDGMDATLLYVIERGGIVKVVVNETTTTGATDFLDIRSRVSAGGEKGLLGLAFHPDYVTNGYFYVYYSTSGGPKDHLSRISRFSQSSTDVYPPTADPESELVLLEVAQPYGNHNGGGLAFGPDGYLYVALGDGGSGGDPEENGQDETNLLGSILRLDVDGGGTAPDCGGAEGNYTVPADNALADGPGGACDEIYAWGLRNPWRFSFDRASGQGWIADVGQGQWEEVNRMENGGNYGWDVKEGEVCFEDPGPGEPPCDDPSLIDPVWVYGHSGGDCSVTGGYVYRGETVSELQGRYIYGDYCSGRVWALDASGDEPANELLDVSAPVLTSFGEDADGELYLTRFNSFNDSNGKVYRFASSTVSTENPGERSRALRLEPPSPNPFSGATDIAFSIPESGPVRLTVYDILGREVARLFDGVAGTEEQSVRFDARGLRAGIYVVRLEAEGVSRTRKVVLAR